MLTAKLPIIGTVARIEPGKIIVRSGDRTDSYNPLYYRIMPDQSEYAEGREPAGGDRGS
ncbi:hypothetical protein [Paenibacillus sp. GCM10012303]|uniref:hypothetical protein n=1 Tax=Paenibacillus sp. GCM10012303 TaxID=3317340 RepID=UPI00360C9348